MMFIFYSIIIIRFYLQLFINSKICKITKDCFFFFSPVRISFFVVIVVIIFSGGQ